MRPFVTRLRGERRHKASTTGPKVGRRVLTPPPKVRTSEHSGRVAPRRDRSAPRSREVPKGSRHVRNSVSSLIENFAKVMSKRDTKVALRGQPRGVSSDHVYSRAFGDAFYQT